MNEAALFVAIAGVVVALVALLRRTNFPEVMALIIALVVVGATMKYGQSTTLNSGAVCPGAFGGNIEFSDAAWRSFDQMNAEQRECRRLVDKSAENLLWVWIIGVAGFIFLMMMSRSDRREAEKRRK